MRALVICGESIGDLVFATPVFRALKVQLDDVEVHGLFSRSSVFLAEENPYIDQTFRIQENILKTWKLLKAQEYDFVVNLRTDVRSILLASLFHTKTYSIKSNTLQQWLMVYLKINRLSNIHVVEQLMDVLKPLGIKTDELGLDFFIPERDKVSLDWLPHSFRKEFVVFALTAPYATRKLPVGRMIELCDRINKPIILLGSPADADTGEKISDFFAKKKEDEWEEGLKKLNKRTAIHNACGKFNINQMASLVRQSRAVFAFDSDFIPVASAFRKEIFCVWGNTILLFGRYPYRTKFTVLESDKVSCRPCSTQGFHRCPKRHFRCMNSIYFDFYLP